MLKVTWYSFTITTTITIATTMTTSTVTNKLFLLLLLLLVFSDELNSGIYQYFCDCFTYTILLFLDNKYMGEVL